MANFICSSDSPWTRPLHSQTPYNDLFTPDAPDSARNPTAHCSAFTIIFPAFDSDLGFSPGLAERMSQEMIAGINFLLTALDFSSCSARNQKNQWGFQPGKSCVTALLATTNIWHEALEQGKDVAVIFFDFQKAFDSVPHQPLIKKLHDIELNSHLIQLVSSYLLNRKQKVIIDGSESEMVHAISGVPQGSVLGPLLFLIYINDLCNISFSPGGNIVIYADDVVLYKIIDSNSAHGNLQEDINKIVQWTDVNLLTLNRSKCKTMLLSRKNHQLNPLFIQDETIEQVCCYKYLGLIITPNLKWDDHIERITIRARRLLGYLYRVYYRNVESKYLVNLYTSLVRPHLEYACQVWDPHNQKNIEQLERIQKYALRICTGQWNTRYNDLLDVFKLPRLSNRREYLRIVTLFQFHNNNFYLPSGTMTQARATSSRQQTSHGYTIPYARTSSYQQSFFPRTISVWNNLPESMIESNTSHFKSLLKNYIL